MSVNQGMGLREQMKKMFERKVKIMCPTISLENIGYRSLIMWQSEIEFCIPEFDYAKEKIDEWVLNILRPINRDYGFTIYREL